MMMAHHRGNRLLERSRLSPENQRLVLVGSAYNLAYEAIVESLRMSFPEHKPPPLLFGKDSQSINQSKQDRVSHLHRRLPQRALRRALQASRERAIVKVMATPSKPL